MVNNMEMDDKKVESLWAHLHWLIVLAQQGSFTSAAQRLGVSKAAMSQHVAELERAAGMALVQRTTRSVRLTDAGQRLVDEMQVPFEQIAASFSGVRESAGAPRGQVKITAPVAFARQQLVPRLAMFLQQYPEVRITLDLSDRISALAMEGFDLAVRHAQTIPDTHVAWPLCTTHTVLVASRSYLRRRGSPTEPLALAEHDCLHYPRAQATPAWHFEPIAPAVAPKKAAAALPRITVPVRGPFAANNSEALRDAALAGLGIALLPDFSAQTALQSGKLVAVLPEWRSVGAFAEQLWAVRPYASHVPRAVTVFVAWLRDALRGGFVP